jgi:hypothetical protein
MVGPEQMVTVEIRVTATTPSRSANISERAQATVPDRSKKPLAPEIAPPWVEATCEDLTPGDNELTSSRVDRGADSIAVGPLSRKTLQPALAKSGSERVEPRGVEQAIRIAARDCRAFD